MIVLAWFAYSLHQTLLLEEEASKRKFYIIFGGLATLWFLLLPFFVLGMTKTTVCANCCSGTWHPSVGQVPCYHWVHFGI